MRSTRNANATARNRMARLRKEAAHRKRRIIMDNDGNDAVYLCKDARPETLLKTRTTGLVGTQVDTVVYSPWNACFFLCTHPTSVGEIWATKRKVRGDDVTERERRRGKANAFTNNITADLVRQGTDTVRVIGDFCHENGIEFFYGRRMQDLHDSWTGSWSAAAIVPQWKRDHPECLFGSPGHRPPHGGWAGVDYARREVRDLAFRWVEEVCENYDVDGLMLDYLRNPSLFKRQVWGQELGQRELDLLTTLMRRIRRRADTIAVRRGRPILIGVRVPDSVGVCNAVGIDIERWLREDLADILVTTCHFRFNPWETSVALGHQFDVPVYPCLSSGGQWLKGENARMRNLRACYRARAMNVWDAGADGVYLFNYYGAGHSHHSPLLREMGDPGTLRAGDRVYTTCARGHKTERYLPDGERFINRSLLTPLCPRRLKPGQTEEVELRVGETVKPGKGRQAPKATLRLQARALSHAADLTVKLNGNPLRSSSIAGTWLDYRVPPTLVKRGVNRFELMLEPKSRAELLLTDLLLWVRPARSGRA